MATSERGGGDYITLIGTEPDFVLKLRSELGTWMNLEKIYVRGVAPNSRIILD